MPDEETKMRVNSCRGRGSCACGRDPEDDSGFFLLDRDPGDETDRRLEAVEKINRLVNKGVTPRHPSSQAFHDRVTAWLELHDRKQRDYGSDTDPFANIREGARQLGLPGWIGAVVRMNDKMRRLNTAAKQYIETGEVNLLNEGVVDSFDDLGVYSGIGACLFEEEQGSS